MDYFVLSLFIVLEIEHSVLPEFYPPAFLLTFLFYFILFLFITLQADLELGILLLQLPTSGWDDRLAPPGL